MLERLKALQRIIGDTGDFAVIAGLGSAVYDMARLTENASSFFPLDGAMGAAVSLGLGLALQRPDLHVLVVTGDGELLMNVGALATVAVHDPANLSIVCADNGQYGMTGGQTTHTALTTDLAAIAVGAGIRQAMVCRDEDDLDEGARLVRSREHASLVVLKVDSMPSATYPVDRDASACRVRMVTALTVDTGATEAARSKP